MVDISRIRGSITVALGTELIAPWRGLLITSITSDKAKWILLSSGLVQGIYSKCPQ